MKKYIVYKHTCVINNKSYIGQTNREFKTRCGNNGCHYKGSTFFYKAINKYGWDNFTHEILKEDLSKEEANYWESFYINYYNTQNSEYGYNLTAGGEGAQGLQVKEETRQKLSKSLKECFNNNPDARKHLSDLNKGKKLSKETCKKMSENQQKGVPHRLGKHHLEETKQKISNSKKGKKIGKDNVNSKPVRCIETGVVYESMSLAAIDVGQSSYSHISQCCHHKRSTCAGYHWEFVI